MRLDLKEIDDWRVARLSAAQADLLAASEAVQLRPAGRGAWEVKASGVVGAAVLGNRAEAWVDLRVQPKVSIDRLLFLMTFAHSPGAWREESVDLPPALDLPAGVAEVFVRVADRALRQGVLAGYRTLEEASMTFRGRLRESDQIRRRFGMALPTEIVYDDYGPDIAENQILRAALWRVMSIPGVPPRTRRRLLRLRQRLVGVTDLTGGQRLPAWQPGRLNARYQPALRLAELILRSSSFDLGRGAVPAVGFLVSMPTVFEAFVTVALGREMERRFGGRAVMQDKAWFLDAEREISLRPDLVWYPSPGHPGVVVDAKYKAESVAGFPNADAYQMLAYCSALRLPVGHLVYAKGFDKIRGYRLPYTGLDGAGVEVVAHALDLSKEPEGLLRQAEELAARISTVIQPA